MYLYFCVSGAALSTHKQFCISCTVMVAPKLLFKWFVSWNLKASLQLHTKSHITSGDVHIVKKYLNSDSTSTRYHLMTVYCFIVLSRFDQLSSNHTIASLIMPGVYLELCGILENTTLITKAGFHKPLFVWLVGIDESYRKVKAIHPKSQTPGSRDSANHFGLVHLSNCM